MNNKSTHMVLVCERINYIDKALRQPTRYNSDHRAGFLEERPKLITQVDRVFAACLGITNPLPPAPVEQRCKGVTK